MTKKQRFDISYMKMAVEWGKNSYCNRNKVGALIVKDGSIVSDGFNGTASNTDNNCEDENGNTHWYVLHAEMNCITKLAKNSNSSIGATLYVTLSCCRECSKLILQSKIARVVYLEEYRDTSGIDFLRSNGVIVEKIVI